MNTPRTIFSYVHSDSSTQTRKLHNCICVLINGIEQIDRRFFRQIFQVFESLLRLQAFFSSSSNGFSRRESADFCVPALPFAGRRLDRIRIESNRDQVDRSRDYVKAELTFAHLIVLVHFCLVALFVHAHGVSGPVGVVVFYVLAALLKKKLELDSSSIESKYKRIFIS